MEPDGEVGGDAVEDRPDWEALRKQSLEPGGFGEGRVHIWPQLLRVAPTSPKLLQADRSDDKIVESVDSTTAAADALPVEAHRDERQIQLDTERSFVLYPVEGGVTKSRESLQCQLHELLLAVFRKHPKLSYFQGYHDIITVIFMTLPPEMQLICAEKMSLQRLRDSMGSTLEPVLGLLRVLKNVLRLADPTYSSLLERKSPLPYYALSNLLTLFAHDMPTLSLVQHVFDYLLCRPPIAVVYLAAALLLSRRSEVEKLEQEGEEVHSLLSGLPDISDGVPLGSIEDGRAVGSAVNAKADNKPGGVCVDVYEPLDEGVKLEPNLPNFPIPAPQVDEADEKHPATATQIKPLFEPAFESISDIAESRDDITLYSKVDDIREMDEKPLDPSCIFPSHPRRASITLSSLLEHADELYSSFPPTHPSVALSSIMGPQSVMFTWSEHLSEMPDDSEAELMVQNLDLIVRPYFDKDGEGDKESGKDRRQRRKSGRPPTIAGIVIQRRTIVAGAVLVVGVGMAVYGMHARSMGPFSGVGDGGWKGHAWRRVGAWVGGALAAGSEHLIVLR